LRQAVQQKADIFITADFKYHQFFDAEDRIIIADIGHYESEQFTIDLFYELITNKFDTFAVYKTAIHTNPVNYL
jgi:putative NIF3 family GTP cyclohydrolase 1 type 2